MLYSLKTNRLIQKGQGEDIALIFRQQPTFNSTTAQTSKVVFLRTMAFGMQE